MPRTRFKNLTPEEREWLLYMLFTKEHSIAERIRLTSERFGVTKRTAWAWRARVKQELAKDAPPDNPYLQAANERRTGKTDYMIFTWAQNATPVHDDFFNNLLSYADFLGAEVHIIPGRYRNPSLFHRQGSVLSTEWWDDRTTPYLNSNREEMAPGLVYVGDVKIQPTAINPMSGMHSLVGESTAIFGHPKIQFQSKPRLAGQDVPPLHLTTGACTMRNYSDTKAGKKGEHHHRLGFVILEHDRRNDLYHVRQVVAHSRSGEFTDLFFRVANRRVERVESCKGFVMGDVHEIRVESGVVDATTRYLDRVAPEEGVVIHDVFDGVSVNHHEAANPFQAFRRYERGEHLLAEEVERVRTFTEPLLKYHPVFAFSNHCEWIDRYLAREDWKKDIPNALTYLRYAQILLEHKPEGGLLHHLLQEWFGEAVTTLGPRDSHRIGDWEVGMHGHLGINGSRGSMTGFRRFNAKMISAHLHSVARYEDTVQVGTYTQYDMGYNPGPSDWCHAGAVVHQDDQVQQLVFRPVHDGAAYNFTTLWDKTLPGE